MSAYARRRGPTQDPALVRWALTLAALGFIALFLALPLVAVFVEAFRRGADAYLSAISHRDAVAAIWLTLTVAAIAVPLNLVFGSPPPGRSRSSSSRARAC